jgi:hypothetical protein
MGLRDGSVTLGTARHKETRMTRRFVFCVTAALLLVACEDATGPSETDPVPAPGLVASTTGSFSTNVVLSGNLATTGNPITYTVDFGRRFSSISRVSYSFIFGDDPLDLHDCMYIFPSDVPSGLGGFCNPNATAQTSRQFDFPCTTHSEGCDHFRDGVSGGEFTVESGLVGGPRVSVSLRSVTITIDGEAAPAVSIDIRPGSSTNRINPRSRGLIPVAILTTATFNATSVNPASVRFGPAGATKADRRVHLKDVDRDGDRDLVLHFRASASGIKCGDSFAGVTGATRSGESFEGSDAIQTVGCNQRRR